MKNLLIAFTSFFHKKKKDTALVSEKEKIRAEIRIQKKLLSPEKITEESNLVYAKIESLPEFQQAKSILMYWSLTDEFPTHDFIIKWFKTKTILLPVVQEGNLLIRKFTGVEHLNKGHLGILEPENQDLEAPEIDIVITPGMAFDKSKRRLGRGKGYYDRFLRYRNVLKWGVGFDFQVYENIPVASFDIKMDKVITASYNI